MISALLDPYTLVWAIPAAFLGLYLVARLHLEYRLATAPGVRAHVTANNPITGTSLLKFGASLQPRANFGPSRQDCRARCAHAKREPSL